MTSAAALDASAVGMGVIAPGATSVDALSQHLRRGVSTARWLPISDDDLPLVGCPVDDGDWLSAFSRAELRRFDRIAHLGLAAADQAVAASGVWDRFPPERRGLAVGIGFGGITTLTAEHQVLLERTWRRLNPFSVVATMPSSVAALGAIRFGVEGWATTVSSACASGTQALIEGARLLREGAVDVVLAGGAEAPLARLPLGAFQRMDAMAPPADDVATSCRPFAADRTGFVIGEGSGFVVLVRQETADELGTGVLATLAGWSMTTDAHHVSAPEAAGPTRSVRDALRMARIEPEAVGHVNAHGTGTRLNDAVEGDALAAVFGPRQVPVTSNKGVIGHLMGGAGAVEAVAAITAMREGCVPPTANCARPDDAIPLDVVVGSPRAIDVAPVVSCSFGFGGQNAALVLNPGPAPRTPSQGITP